jgi:hypothetical protein|tara:strand:- start:2726 stop:3130 length:405 start_codon:yes stop_codon:yes gene_type:complete
MSNNELAYWQRVLLGIEKPTKGWIQVKNNTLYRRSSWTYYKGKRIRGWLPVFTKDNKDWIGYNYSGKDYASYLLRHPHYHDTWHPKLKWVEIGRGIGNRDTSSEWRYTMLNHKVITKMINPTLDMLLPFGTFEE